MKTMLEARMVAISTARLTSFGQETGRVGTLCRMNCSSQGALKIATIRSLASLPPRSWPSRLGCRRFRVTYSLHKPAPKNPSLSCVRAFDITAEGEFGMSVVVNYVDLPYVGNSHELEGYLYEDAPVCIILFDG